MENLENARNKISAICNQLNRCLLDTILPMSSLKISPVISRDLLLRSEAETIVVSNLIAVIGRELLFVLLMDFRGPTRLVPQPILLS